MLFREYNFTKTFEQPYDAKGELENFLSKKNKRNTKRNRIEKGSKNLKQIRR